MKRALAFADPRVNVDRRADGSIVLESPHPLGAYPRNVVDRFRHWSEAAPERVVFAERSSDGSIRRVSYGAARARVDRLAQGLLERGLDEEHPLLVLSENAVDHALLTLAAMTAGVPIAPASTAYSLASSDFVKLTAIASLLRPGLVYASDGERYGRALEAIRSIVDRVVVSARPSAGAATIEELERAPTDALERRFQAQTPDTIAKILFTSGSTGEPKGVVNTQRMLCSNQRAIEVAWPFLRARAPSIVDWLPWSHTFGGNHNFNMMLFHGGTLFVDEGKPTPELIVKTAQNLRDQPSTMHFNVPRGFDVLLPLLEQDASLAKAFFAELDVVFYAAASLPNPLWERLEQVSLATRGDLVTMLSAWGSTETSPMATTVHFPIRRAGVIGLPGPGTAIKLAPSGSKLELRVKGPNVTPGYWKRPELAAASFDEEGFFKMGDAGKLADDRDPSKGIVFDGRIAEDFKLRSATWVHVGKVRASVVAACAPLVQDAVIAGLDRDDIGALLVLSPSAKALSREELHARLRAALGAYCKDHPQSSERVARALILEDALGIDAGEITDKGYINQRAVLERRAHLVDALYDEVAGVLLV